MSTETNLKSVIVELHGVFSQHLPADDVAAVLRKAVEKALAEVLGNAPKRRGRPPKNAGAASASPGTKKRKGRSPASRALQARKMKAYWAARKASESGKSAAKGTKKKRARPAKAAKAKPARDAAVTAPAMS